MIHVKISHIFLKDLTKDKTGLSIETEREKWAWIKNWGGTMNKELGRDDDKGHRKERKREDGEEKRNGNRRGWDRKSYRQNFRKIEIGGRQREASGVRSRILNLPTCRNYNLLRRILPDLVIIVYYVYLYIHIFLFHCFRFLTELTVSHSLSFSYMSAVDDKKRVIYWWLNISPTPTCLCTNCAVRSHTS